MYAKPLCKSSVFCLGLDSLGGFGVTCVKWANQCDICFSMSCIAIGSSDSFWLKSEAQELGFKVVEALGCYAYF